MNDEAFDLFAAGGEMRSVMRAVDWSATPLGPVEGWSQALRTMVGLLLRNQFPLLLWWGPQHIQLYNDAYRPVPGDKHPRSMGQPAAECWPEIWDVIGPMIEVPFRGGPATTSDDLFLLVNRSGFVEETHFKVAYSPVPDCTVPETGVGGVLATVSETTQQVYSERQLRTLRDLGARALVAKTPAQACASAAATFAENDWDVPFALLYLLDDDGKHARLAASSGFDGPAHETPVAEIDMAADPALLAWPLPSVASGREPVVLDGLDARAGALPSGRWSHRPRTAIALPLASPEQAQAYGVLICGISPHRALDVGYRTFFELAAAQVVTAVRNARAYEAERRRAEALAELDRAKTAFFSNVSHEFRTPLTLMLGPQEDALASADGALAGEALRVVHRNTQRLLRLVNTLLDFSRLEAGRERAAFEPTDLAQLTADLASAFRSAIERGGLRFDVDCPPLAEPVYVDRDMWEKIVLNLLSNAFKFTFEGSISVALRAAGDRVELEVADSGIGIAEADLGRLFERFHRVEGARARTFEGSGIGLSLVQDLCRLHAGTIRVASEVGAGTRFVVSFPFGRAHLPAERVSAPRPLAGAAARAEPFVQEALRWTPDGADDRAAPVPAPAPTAASTARVLVADDNADMRDYLTRLLRQRWTVDSVSDGQQALERARAQPPDLVLTDVMMPGLDGFGLLRALRADPRTARLPVIMLSARAGEESSVDGLAAGADDYLVKPFSARELVARVHVHLENARLRRAIESASHAKDAFLAMLGHEMRNPLAPILTSLQLMRMRGHHSREQEIIERQVDRLVRLVDDLLDISRITRGKVELKRRRMELAEAVVGGVEMASPLFEARHQVLEMRVPRTGLAVWGDRDRLAQVMSNLLNNAAKYSAPGSTVHVAAEAAGGVVRLRVRDGGAGIAPEMLAHIFEPFVQEEQSLERAKGGLGLGLAIVRSLVELHGGTVSAASDGPGRGSEFVVELPLAHAAEEANALAADSAPFPNPAPPSPAGMPRRILVVDDNADAAEVLAEALRGLGYEVATAQDGPAALTVAKRFRPNVCLVDIGLPVMDGYELAQHLRESTDLPDTVRMIAITGYGQAEDRRRSRAAGFNAHLVKPVSIDDLTRSLVN